MVPAGRDLEGRPEVLLLAEPVAVGRAVLMVLVRAPEGRAEAMETIGATALDAALDAAAEADAGAEPVTVV